jgi:hypothetical protein
MNIKHYTHCPECGEKWIGEPIPLEDRHKYEPPYFYYHLIEYATIDPDNKFIYECPGCRGFFPRFYDPEKTDINIWRSILNAYATSKDSMRCGNCHTDLEESEEILKKLEEVVILKEE